MTLTNTGGEQRSDGNSLNGTSKAGSGSLRQIEGRISRAGAVVRLQLLNLSYDQHHVHTSSNIALVLLRDIKSTPVRIRRTVAYVRKVRNQLIVLNNYNRATYEAKGKYPYSKALILLLVRYVQLEYDVLYHQENYSAKYEEEVEDKVRYLLDLMLDGVVRKYKRHNSCNAASECVLRVLNQVNTEFKIKGRFICSLINKLAKKLGLLATISELRENGVLLSQNHPAFQKLSCESIEDISDCESDDASEIPTSPARSCVSPFEKLKLESPKREPPDLDSGQELQFLYTDDDYNSFFFPGLQRLKSPQRDVLLFGPKSENLNSNGADDSTDLITGHVNDLNNSTKNFKTRDDVKLNRGDEDATFGCSVYSNNNRSVVVDLPSFSDNKLTINDSHASPNRVGSNRTQIVVAEVINLVEDDDVIDLIEPPNEKPTENNAQQIPSQDVSPQEVSPQEMSHQEVSPPEVSAQEVSLQEVSPQEVPPNEVSPEQVPPEPPSEVKDISSLDDVQRDENDCFVIEHEEEILNKFIEEQINIEKDLTSDDQVNEISSTTGKEEIVFHNALEVADGLARIPVHTFVRRLTNSWRNAGKMNKPQPENVQVHALEDLTPETPDEVKTTSNQITGEQRNDAEKVPVPRRNSLRISSELQGVLKVSEFLQRNIFEEAFERVLEATEKAQTLRETPEDNFVVDLREESERTEISETDVDSQKRPTISVLNLSPGHEAISDQIFERTKTSDDDKSRTISPPILKAATLKLNRDVATKSVSTIESKREENMFKIRLPSAPTNELKPIDETSDTRREGVGSDKEPITPKLLPVPDVCLDPQNIEKSKSRQSLPGKDEQIENESNQSETNRDTDPRIKSQITNDKPKERKIATKDDSDENLANLNKPGDRIEDESISESDITYLEPVMETSNQKSSNIDVAQEKNEDSGVYLGKDPKFEERRVSFEKSPNPPPSDCDDVQSPVMIITCKVLSELVDPTTPVAEGKNEDDHDENSISSHPSEQSKTDDVRTNANQDLKPDDPPSLRNDLPQFHFKPSIMGAGDAPEKAFEDVREEPNPIITTCDNRPNSTDDVGKKTTPTLKIGQDADDSAIRMESTPQFPLTPPISRIDDSSSKVLENGREENQTGPKSDLTSPSASLNDLDSTESVASELENVLASSHIAVNDGKISDDPDERGCLNSLSAELERILVDPTGEGDVLANPSKSQHKCHVESGALPKLFEDETGNIQSDTSAQTSPRRDAKSTECEVIESDKSPLVSSKSDAQDTAFEDIQSEKSLPPSSKSTLKHEASKSIQLGRSLAPASEVDVKDAASKYIQSDKSPLVSSKSDAKNAQFEDIQSEKSLPPSSKSTLKHEASKSIQLERSLAPASEVDVKDAVSKYIQSDKSPLVSSKSDAKNEFEGIQSEKSLPPFSKSKLKHEATKSIQLERSLSPSIQSDTSADIVQDRPTLVPSLSNPDDETLLGIQSGASISHLQNIKDDAPALKENDLESTKGSPVSQPQIQEKVNLDVKEQVDVPLDEEKIPAKTREVPEAIPAVLRDDVDVITQETESSTYHRPIEPKNNTTSLESTEVNEDHRRNSKGDVGLGCHGSKSTGGNEDILKDKGKNDVDVKKSEKSKKKDLKGKKSPQSERTMESLLIPQVVSPFKVDVDSDRRNEKTDTKNDIDQSPKDPEKMKSDDKIGDHGRISVGNVDHPTDKSPTLTNLHVGDVTVPESIENKQKSHQQRMDGDKDPSPILNDSFPILNDSSSKLNDSSPILNDPSPILNDPSPIPNDRETSEVALKSDVDGVSIDSNGPKRDVPSDEAIQNLHFQVGDGMNAENEQKDLGPNFTEVFDPESQQYYLLLDGEENAQIEFRELNQDIEKDENVLYILGSPDCEEVSFVIEGNEENIAMDRSELPKVEDGASSDFGNVERDEGGNFVVGDGEYQYDNDIPSVDNEVCLDYCEMQSSPSEGDDDVVLSVGTEEMEKVKNDGISGDVKCDDSENLAEEKIDLKSTNENVLGDADSKSNFELEKPDVVPEFDDAIKTDVNSETAENPERYPAKDSLENQETISEPQGEVVGSYDDVSAPSGIHPPKVDDLGNERSENLLDNPNETHTNFEPPQNDDLSASPEIYLPNHDTLETDFVGETPEDETNDIIDNTGDGCSVDVSLEEEPEDKNDNILEPDIILREIDTKLRFDAEPPKFSNYIPAHTEFCPIEGPDQPPPIEVVPIAAITIASENYRQTFDVPLASTTNKLDHPYENLQILATAAAAQRSLEIKAKSKRSRVKMAAKTHAKAQKKQEEEFQPNEVIETVPKQPVKTVYTTTTESDFNTVSEDSCDSFVGKLIIAEDLKVREQSPTEVKPVPIDINIFDEDTVDENLSFVPTTFEERDDVDLMEGEGHASLFDGVTHFNTDLDEEFDDEDVDDSVDVQSLGNYPRADVTVQPSTSKAGSYVNTTIAENFKLKLPPTDYSIATILSMASTHEKIKQNQNLLKKIEGKFRKKGGKKLKKKLNKVGGGAKVEGLSNREQCDNRVGDATIVTGDSQAGDQIVIEESQIAIGNQITIEQSQTSQDETEKSQTNEETKKPPKRENHVTVATSSILTDDGEILQYYTETQVNTDSFVTTNQTIGASLYEVRYDRENPLGETDQQLVTDNRQPIRTKAELKAYDKKNHAMPQDKINLNSYVKLVRDPHMQQLIEKEYVEKRPLARKMEKITLGRKSYRNLLDARRLLLTTQPVQNQAAKKLEIPKGIVVVDNSNTRGNLVETKTNEDVKVSSPIKSEKFDEIPIEKVDPKPKQDIIKSSIDETIDEVVKSTEIEMEIETEIIAKARKVTRSRSIEITKLNQSETNVENPRTRSGNVEKAKNPEWMRGRRLIRSASVDAKMVENLFIESPRGAGRPKKTAKHDDLVVSQIETPKRELRSSRIDSGETTPLTVTSIATRRSSRECRRDTAEHVDSQNQDLSFKKAKSKLSAIGTTIEEIVDEVVPSKRLSRSSKELRDIIKVDEMMRMGDIERKEKPKIEIEIIPIKSTKDGTGKKGMDLRRNSPAKRKRSGEDIQIDDECRKKADAETIKAKKSKKSMADEDHQNLNKSNFEGNVNKLDPRKAPSVAVKTQNLPDSIPKSTTKAEMPDKWSPVRKGEHDQSKKMNEEKKEEKYSSDVPNESKKGEKLRSDIPSQNKDEGNTKKEENLCSSDIPNESKKGEKLRSAIPSRNKDEGNMKKEEKHHNNIPNDNKDEGNIKKEEEDFDAQKIEVAAPKQIVAQSENGEIQVKPIDGGGSSDVPMNLRKAPQANLKREQSVNNHGMSQVKEKRATGENQDDLHPETQKTNDSGIKAEVNRKEAENNSQSKSQIEEKPTAEENTGSKEKITDLRTTFEEERRGESTESKESEEPKLEMKILPKTKKQRLLGHNRNVEETVASDGGNEAKKLPITAGTGVAQNDATISRIASPKKLEETAKKSEILPEISETTPENLKVDTFKKEVEKANEVEETSKNLEVEKTPKNLQVEVEKSEATPNDLEIVAEKLEATPNNVEVDAEKVEATPNTFSEVIAEKTDEIPKSSDIVVGNLEVTSKNLEVEKIKATPEDVQEVVTGEIAPNPDPDKKVKGTNLSESFKDSSMVPKAKTNDSKGDNEIAMSKPPMPEKKKQEIASNPQSTLEDPEGLDRMTSETIEAITLNMMLTKQLALRTEKLSKPVVEPKPAIKTYDRKSIIKKPQDCKNLSKKKKVTFNIQETSAGNTGSKIKFPKEMMVNTSSLNEQTSRSRASPILLNDTFKFHPQILNFEQRPLDLKITKDPQRPGPPQTNKFKRKLFDEPAETADASKRPKIQDPKNEIRKLKCLVKDTLEKGGEVLKNRDVATSPTKRKDIHTIVDNLRHNLDSKDSKEKAGNVKGWNNREEREKMIEVTVVEVIADEKGAKTGKRVEVGGVNTQKNTISNFKRKEEVKGIKKPRRLDDGGHSLLNVAYMAKSSTTITNKNAQKILPPSSGGDLEQILENSIGSDEKLPLKSSQVKGPRNSESMEVEFCSVTTEPMLAENCEDATPERLKDVVNRNHEVVENCEDAIPETLKDVEIRKHEVMEIENCEKATPEKLDDVVIGNQEVTEKLESVPSDDQAMMANEGLQRIETENQQSITVTFQPEDVATETAESPIVEKSVSAPIENGIMTSTAKSEDVAENQKIAPPPENIDCVTKKAGSTVTNNSGKVVTANSEVCVAEKLENTIAESRGVAVTKMIENTVTDVSAGVITEISESLITEKLGTNEEMGSVVTEMAENVIDNRKYVTDNTENTITDSNDKMKIDKTESVVAAVELNKDSKNATILDSEQLSGEDESMITENNENVIAENDGDVEMKNVEEILVQNRETVASESGESIVTESLKPAVIESLKPAVTESLKPAIIESLKPALIEDGTGDDNSTVTEDGARVLTVTDENMVIENFEADERVTKDDKKIATKIDGRMLTENDDGAREMMNDERVPTEADGKMPTEIDGNTLTVTDENTLTGNGGRLVTTIEQLLKTENADNLLTKKSLEDAPEIPPITSTVLTVKTRNTQEDSESDMSLDVPAPPTLSDISKRPTSLLDITDSLPGSSDSSEATLVASEVKEKWEEMVADESIPPSSVFHTKQIFEEDADSNSNISIKSITEKMITEEVISSSCYNFITCAPLEKLMGHAMISSPIRNPDSYKNLMTPRELEESIKTDNLLEYPLEPMERRTSEADDLQTTNQQGNSSPMLSSAQKDSGYSSDSLVKSSPESFMTIEEDDVNSMKLATSETPLEPRIKSPPISLEKTNSPLSEDVTNSTNSVREPGLEINRLKPQKDVSIFEERQKISDNLLLNFDHDDVDDNMPMAPPFPEITPGSMALAYSTPSTSLNKNLGLMSDIMVSAASQMSNLIPNDITWTNVGVCDSFLLNETFDQQSHNRGQDKIFSNRMKEEVIKMACAKPIEYSLPDPIEERNKAGVDKSHLRVKDESLLTLGGVKSGDFVENVLATSVSSSAVCGSTGLVPITTRISSFVTDQILTTSSGELSSSVSFPSSLSVNPESSNSDLEKDFEAIEEDNTPLSEKAKVYVTIQIAPGTASDHNYSMGGPLLGGKCENTDLPTKQLRQERDTRSSTDVPDNSPIETDIIFPFSEQVCINLIENNLAQETNRSLNQSPIDASADYQFSEQFAFMENQDASQQLHDTQININYIQMNLKQECDSEEDSNITSLIEEDFSNPMSVEKMNSIQLMHSSSQNRFVFPLANVDLADIERISFTGVTSRATQCGGDEDDILKDMKDRIKDIVCPENPQINKDDIIDSVQTGVTSKNRRFSEKSEEPPAKKIKTDSSLTNFSSAMKAKAMADIERKKLENKQKEVHNSGYPIRQNNKTPVFAPIKNVSPSPNKKSPLPSKSRSNSSSPIVKSFVETEQQMLEQRPLIEEKISPGKESVATSTSDRPMTPPATPIDDELDKYEIPIDKLKDDIKDVVQAKITEMLTTFCTKSSNELPKLQLDSPNASTSGENFWGDKYDNIKRKCRQRPDRLIDTIVLENLKKNPKIQSKQYYGREQNKPKTPLKSDQPKAKSLKLAKQDEDNLISEEYKTFADKCKLKGNFKGSNRSPERISFDQPKVKSMKLAKQDEDHFITTFPGKNTPQNNFKEPHRSPDRTPLDRTKGKMLSDIYPEGERAEVASRIFDVVKASGNDPHMPLIQKKDNSKTVEIHNNRIPNCEAAGRPSVPIDYLDPKRQPPPPPRKDLRTYPSKAGPSLPHGSSNLVLNTQYQQSRADHYRRYQATTSQNPPKDLRYSSARPPPNGRYGGNASRSSDTSGRRMNFRQPFPYLGNIRVGNPRTSSDDDWRINVGRLIKGLPSVTFDPENKP